MADSGIYLVVVRNDQPVPDVIHGSVRLDTPEARVELQELIQKLHLRQKDPRRRIPFTLAHLVHAPLEETR